MMWAIKPLKLSFYVLLSLAVALFTGGSPLSALPALLFFLAYNAFESFSRTDYDELHGRTHYTAEKKLLTFRIAVFSATLAVLTAFYFSLALSYVFLVILTILATSLVNSHYFLSDLLLSLVPAALVTAHSSDWVLVVPVFWFVFFNELSRRAVSELSRPFGLENNNLPKLFGMEAAIDFTRVLLIFLLPWALLMGRFSTLFPYLVYASSAMLSSCAIYAFQTSRYDATRKLLRLSGWLFLSGFLTSIIL